MNPTNDGTKLTDVVTLAQPLGPSDSEELVQSSLEVFSALYDRANHVHRTTHSDNPSYIIGRKGAGKTAFLIGGALAEQSEVVLIRSEEIYDQVNRLRARWIAANGTLSADNLVHIWEVLLLHAAMWGIARSDALPRSYAKSRVWSYMRGFGDPLTMRADALIAAVSARLLDALVNAPMQLSVRQVCWSIQTPHGTLLDTTVHARTVLDAAGERALYVVIDNLEDLHRQLDDYRDVITGLFRVIGRNLAGSHESRLPFKTRFAFPAELLPHLQDLAANPEKDFRDYLVIRWSAAELLVIAGNRVRTFLDLHFKDAVRELRLPAHHDWSDREAAVTTLRAVLPSEIVNGFGDNEDSIAYVLRHTQLLPRQLIIILNTIMGEAVRGVPVNGVPRATPEQVVRGVADAELEIVSGILSTYQKDYPTVAKALTAIKNRLDFVTRTSELHKMYNHAGAKTRLSLTFEEFLEATVAIGALGIVTDDGRKGGRYVQGDFAYTFTRPVKPVNDVDRLCVHPLFVSQLFDDGRLEALAQGGAKVVYPYGTDVNHDRTRS